jgi:hypothetical protein
MKITIEFESTKEATGFMEKFIIDEKTKKKIEAEVPTAPLSKVVNPVKVIEGYGQPRPPFQGPLVVAPVVAPPVAPAPSPVVAPAPVAIPTPVVVPTTVANDINVDSTAPVNHVYTQQEIMSASIALVDAGRREELIALLGTFGIASLAELTPDKYGAYAQHLRAKGCNI